MHALALASLGDQTLKALLASAQRSLGRKSHAIIITPSTETDWLVTLSALKQRGVTTTILLLSPEDFGDERTHTAVTKQLNAWGINYYLIRKSIYTSPKVKEYFPTQLHTLAPVEETPASGGQP